MFQMGINSFEEWERGLEKLSETSFQGTGFKESYESQILEPEVHQGPFFQPVTCVGCPGIPP